MKKIGLLGLLVNLVVATGSTASPLSEVCYVPIWGEALTSCTPDFDADGNFTHPCPEMLGQYKLVMKKSSRSPGQRYLKLAGPLHGKVNLDDPDDPLDPFDQTLNHILGDEDGKGLIYTFGDTVVGYEQLDECVFQVTEELNITLGTGIYAGAHGKITVLGEVNGCTGVNEFDIPRNRDEVCFAVTRHQQSDDD
jgi:hypothetical protein